MAASTAAAPDMSHFIVSMPLGGLSERPPESNTTPLPTRARALPRAPGGEYVSFTNRGVCAEPWPTPSTPPSFFWRSWGTSMTCTVTPLPRMSLRASAATSAGAFSFDGVFTRSRAQRTAVAITDPRPTAARTPVPPPTIVTLASFDGDGSRLYSRNWYEPSSIPSATACAASAVGMLGAAPASVVATDATLLERRATAAAARRRPSAVSSSGFPMPTTIAALARSAPPVGTAIASPRRPSKPTSSRKAASPPPRASSSTSAPGPSTRVGGAVRRPVGCAGFT
jgi:hypothetical protein